MTTAEIDIRPADPERVDALIPDLAILLQRCVADGANINFIAPFETADAEAFWRRDMVAAVRAGERALWTAWVGGRLAGTVQLALAPQPNQTHRAEVAKLLVAPAHRRRGIAAALLCVLEAEAARRGRWLITLDTRTGDAAEILYQKLGYEISGRIPDFCRDVYEDRLHPTTFMFKRLKRG